MCYNIVVFWEGDVEMIISTADCMPICQTTDQALERKVAQSLVCFGINPKHKGYCLIKDCIMLILNNEDISYSMNLSKKVYPIIAEKYGTSSSVVERNVRFAIVNAVGSLGVEKFQSILGFNTDSLISCHQLTSKYYLQLIIEYIRFQ